MERQGEGVYRWSVGAGGVSHQASGNSQHFVVRRVVLVPGAGQAATAEEVLECLSVGLPDMQFQLVGSHLLGAADECLSDVDVLAVGHLPAQQSLDVLQQYMETCGLMYNVYQVSSACTSKHTLVVNGLFQMHVLYNVVCICWRWQDLPPKLAHRSCVCCDLLLPSVDGMNALQFGAS